MEEEEDDTEGDRDSHIDWEREVKGEGVVACDKEGKGEEEADTEEDTDEEKEADEEEEEEGDSPRETPGKR